MLLKGLPIALFFFFQVVIVLDMDLTEWNKACSSKEHGGLAIRRLDRFNNACLAKLKALIIVDSW